MILCGPNISINPASRSSASALRAPPHLYTLRPAPVARLQVFRRSTNANTNAAVLRFTPNRQLRADIGHPHRHLDRCNRRRQPQRAMSDDAYASFLDKANQDVSGPSGSSSSGPKPLKTTDADQPIPSGLKSIDVMYTSDSDEPFEPVALSFGGSKVDSRVFAELVGHEKEVQEMTVQDWDPQGTYKGVVDKVKEFIEGDVKVFRAETTGARVEYFVVGLGGGRVLGVRARSVES